MKPKSLFTLRHDTRAVAAGFLLTSAALPVSADSATWNGTTDSTWSEGTNWSATPVPATGDSATFNNAGGALDVIDLGAGVTINSLLFDTASVAAYTIGYGAVGSQMLTLDNGGAITLNNTINANQLINANLALGANGTITNNGTTQTLTIAGGITGLGSNVTKTGAGTLILSGLSTTAANNYTGTTILGGGTTTLTQDASFSGGLTFGATSSSGTHSTLNLDSASATFAGTMLVQTSTTSGSLYNVITIGTGQKLANNGNVTFSGTAGNRSKLQLSGLGTWEIITSDGTFGGTSTTNGNEMIVDMSGLAVFNANLRTGGSGNAGGTFRIGGLGGSTNARANSVSLATNSTISADSVTFGGAAQTSTHALSLGNGTQTINSDNITMTTGSRDTASTISFRTANGTLKIRGTDGGDSTRSNLTILQGVNTGASSINTFDVTGHSVDLLFDTVRVYNSTVNTSDSATVIYTATFSFDQGALDSNTFEIGRKAAGQLRNTGSAVANIGGSANLTNNATLGTVNMGVLSVADVSANGALNSTLNITGGNTTVNFTTMSMLNSTSADVDADVVSAVNISGGNVTGTGGIDMVTASAAGTANSTLTISGGSLSVGTSGESATNGIYRTATTGTTTLRLNGGSLNLNGNSIGGSGANAITTQFESGTLSNVGEINGGAGITKTTGGTLILTGTNTYTGATFVSAGTLLVNGSVGNTELTVASGATFGGSGSISGNLGLNAGTQLDLTGATLGLTSTGILTASGSSDITLTDFGFASIIGWDYANAALGTYTLINGGSLTLAGSTPIESNPFDFGNGKSGYFQAGSLQAVIIPEPRAALLGSLGILMLLRRRRA